MVNNFSLLYIFEKNDINKTCRSCFEKMFLFVRFSVNRKENEL